MKKYRWLIILLIIVAAGAGIWFWLFNKKEDEARVVTEKPQNGDISNSVTSTGTVQPVDTVMVGTQVSGTIQFMYADFNSKVKKGQLLAQIDKTVLQAQLQQIQANLASATSQLQYTKTNYERQAKLFNVGAISKVDEETAENNYNAAKAQVDNLQSQITAAKKNLSYTEIYSPIDGTVLSRNVNVGQTVAASFNTPTLFVIAKDLTKMQVQAAVDEADIGNVKVAQNATFTVDAFPDDVFKGYVKDIRLEPNVSANVVTYVTMIDAPNDEMKLKPGMTASVTITTKEDKNVLLVSTKALAFKPDSTTLKKYVIVKGRGGRNGGNSGQQKRQHNTADTAKHRQHLQPKDSTAEAAFVWVLQGDTIRQKRIFTGLNDDTYVEVVSGLTQNDDVITGMEMNQKGGKTDAAARSPFMPARNNRGGGGRRPQ